jgi:glycosyltransferase involved in cell wall biosynthesis
VKAFSFTTLYPGFLFPGKTQYVPEGEHSDIESERILSSINPLSYIQTAKQINKFKPDIVIIAYWMSFMVPAYSSICLLLNKKIRIVALVHNAIPHEKRFADKPLAGFFFDRCDAFIVLSEPVKEDVLSLRKKANIVLHPHPIYNHYGDTIQRDLACDTLGIENNKKNLLFFGLIREYKGLDLLIQAMSLLDDSHQLIIAGESYGSFARYETLMDEYSVRDKIKVFNRYIPDAEVPLFFSAADLLVLPYRSATQSGVIPIACHFEIPVLATDVGGLREAIEPSGTGLICAPDPADMAKRIDQLFAMGTESFVQAIREEKKQLSWEGFAHALSDLQ